MATVKESNRASLTKNFIDQLKLPEGTPQFIWDEKLTGFGIKLNPTGMVYIAQGRVNGKTRRVTIGKHGKYTVQQARERAKNLLRDMDSGKDPKTEKKRKQAEAVTLNQVTEAYIKDRRLKPRSITDIRQHVDNSFGSWKDKPVTEISRQKVLNKFRELSSKSQSQANQAFRILRALLNYARATYRPDDAPILPENPVQILSDAKVWNQVQPKSRRIPLDKIGTAWNFLQSLRQDPAQTFISRSVADAVAFAMLTGGRRAEVIELEWDRVDLEVGTWHLPDPKNRNPVTLPLSSQAKAILKDRPKVNEYVFASNRGKTGHIHEPKRIMQDLSKACGVEVSIHDLRRTFTAIAAECGIELWKTKLLMNHKLGQDVTLHSYTETNDLRYLQPEVEKIADWIERQAKIAASDKVITFPGVNHGEE